MEILQLIFSGPGATIIICVTVLILALIYVLFNDKFRGLSLGFKEFKVETPKAPTPTNDTAVEVIQNPRDDTQSKDSTDTSRPPLMALFEASAKQDRAGIEAAIEKMRAQPPFGIGVQELDAFKYNELLGAGFLDALSDLQTIEKNQGSQIRASLYLARYYFETRAFDDAEAHLKIADERAKTDEGKVDISLLRAEILDFTKGKAEAIRILEKQLDNVSEAKERFRLLNEIGNLSKALSDDSQAIIAYEQALHYLPERIETRFRLALTYGANPSLKMLGVRHYRIILQQNHLHSGALNNLGLLYGDFGLKIAKVSLIRKASEQKDGHAIGNLATLYVEFGFSDDAEKILNEALKGPSPSDRAIDLQQFLRRAERQNEENKEKLVHSAEVMSGLVADYAFARQFEANKYIGVWIDAQGKSSLEIEMFGSFYKLTSEVGGKKTFGYSYLLSKITHIDFSAVDQQPSGLLFLPNGDINVAVLFGEDSLRTIQVEGTQVKLT